LITARDVGGIADSIDARLNARCFEVTPSSPSSILSAT